MMPTLMIAALLCCVFVPLVMMCIVAMEAPDSMGGGWDEEDGKSDKSDLSDLSDIITPQAANTGRPQP